MPAINRLLSGSTSVRTTSSKSSPDRLINFLRANKQFEIDQTKRINQHEIQQATLQANAKRLNFKDISGKTYSENEVVGLPFDKQRAYDYFGSGGSDFTNSAKVSPAAGFLNKVTHANDLLVQPQRYSLVGRRTEDLGDLYRNQQFGVSQKRIRRSPDRDPYLNEELIPINRTLNAGKEADEYAPVSLTSSRDFGEKYAEQQAQIEAKRGHALSISDFFNTKEAREFQYMSGTRGMESPGFKLSPEQQDRLYGIDFARNYTDEARINRAVRRVTGDAVGLEDIPAHEFYGALPTPRGSYDEITHMRSNTATSTNVMNGGGSGPTPPSSSNTAINPNTVPTGTTNYSGYYQPSAAPLNGGALGSIEAGGGLGIAASMGLGALVGGTANYATGGSFGEGAMMGGLAGGAIKIGSRAIAANEAGIENYLQRTALGSDMTAGMNRNDAARLIGARETAGEGAGFMQNQAFNILKSQNPSMGMQSRYMVMGGSALSGIAFTGRRNDKRRGFNSHRGNRI